MTGFPPSLKLWQAGKYIGCHNFLFFKIDSEFIITQGQIKA